MKVDEPKLCHVIDIGHSSRQVGQYLSFFSFPFSGLFHDETHTTFAVFTLALV